eukprot:3323166-Pyramimonas_sp.AAC.1
MGAPKAEHISWLTSAFSTLEASGAPLGASWVPLGAESSDSRFAFPLSGCLLRLLGRLGALFG